MAVPTEKKRKFDDKPSSRPRKKKSKQIHYSSPSASSASSSSDEVAADEAANTILSESKQHLPSPPSAHNNAKELSETSSASDSDTGSEHFASSNPNHTRLSKSRSKRNDPDAFASSISAILGSKLSTSKRADPVLARSVTAAQANTEISNSRLETKARRKLRDDKKEALDKGRVKNVLLGTASAGGEGLDSAKRQGDEDQMTVGETQELEKRLRKTAQRGVVKLFNAVRQAQIRGEEARKKGGSRGRKEERVGEMTKKGFLELVAGGGNGKKNGLENLEAA